MHTFTRVTAGLVLVGAAAGIPLQATAASAASIKFGSKLDASIQPSNSVPGVVCDQADPSAVCSFVMNEAYGRPDGGEVAPRNGVLRKIRVISGDTTSFQLQLVKSKKVNGMWKSKVRAQGPTIHVQGQSQANWDSDQYKVEVFKVGMKIKKGWRLSMIATHTPAVRCSSGGPNTLIYGPPLATGEGFRATTSDDGCWPLIEGVIKY